MPARELRRRLEKLETIVREKCVTGSIVGDAFAAPLIDDPSWATDGLDTYTKRATPAAEATPSAMTRTPWRPCSLKTRCG